MSRHHDRIKNDPRWKAARVDCLDRDDHTCTCPGCVVCGTGCSSQDELEVDHIEPLSVVIDTAPELAFALDNLRTLCRPCHTHRAAVTHTRRLWVNPRWPELLAEVLV